MSEPTWIHANAAWMQRRIQAFLERARGEDAAAPEWLGPAGTAPALEVLAEAFELTAFEVDLIVWAFIDPAALARAELSPPSFAGAIQAFGGGELRAMSPEGPLRTNHLVVADPRAPLLTAPLALDERVQRFLIGDATLDAQILAAIRPSDALPALDRADSRVPQAERAARRLTELTEHGDLPVVNLYGGTAADRLFVGVAVAVMLGLRPCVAEPDDLAGLVGRWEREARLADVALVLDARDDALTAARRILARVGGVVLLLTATRVDIDARPALAIEVQGPDTAALGVAWRTALATVPGADAFPELPRELAATFLLDAAGVESVGIELVAGYSGSLQEAAWDAARRRARADIEPLAERVASRATWSDLVLPPEPTALLEELVSHFRHRVRVHDDWGLSAHGSRADGVVALFSGPSGVGKSLAAEVVANTLALDLWRVDLASLVSKYIGETEKNLGRVFDAAERGACVLLFDEADALFGKRTEVRDSHDRHANLEVSYLLQRLERYRGIAILTTNLRANVDVAFQRRFRLSVEFPFPGPAERVRMWSRVFPPATPTRGLDPERLAQLNVSGALIRNIALRAAFFAASEGGPVTMAHVARAAKADYQQREQRMSKAEAAGWAD